MRRTIQAFLAVAVLSATLPLFAQQTQAARRVALVVGNGDYRVAPKLANPVNDAGDMASALQGLGFEVILVKNGTQAQMDGAVDEFARKLPGAEAGLFYYAGHGVQSQGQNYLIPVDAAISAEYQLRAKTLDAAYLLEAMNASGCPLNIVVLDACRDNPFAAMRSMNRGLSVMGAAPAGAIIVYATDPGKTAQDGKGRNGVFTGALIKRIAMPGLEVKDLFDQVGAEVAEATGRAQNPWISSKFYGKYYLAGAAKPAPPPPPAPAPAVQAAPPEPAPQPLVKQEAAKRPTITVTKAYGSLVVKPAMGGVLYLDGTEIGEIAAGAEARIDDLEVGTRALEMRYADGQRESATALVEKGAAAEVAFARVAARAAPPAAPERLGDLALVRGGRFAMGSSDGQGDERPVHEVTVSDFYIARHEVTQGRYYEVTGKRPSRYGQSYYGYGTDRFPVERVSWLDAVAFCNALSEIEGLEPVYSLSGLGGNVRADFRKNGYRLPTEAEWEYAARGGSGARPTKYSGSDDPAKVAVFDVGDTAVGTGGGNRSQSGLKPVRTREIGGRAPNTLGLFDMSGNVAEWCWDLYDDYPRGAQTDPIGGAKGSSRVVRGGSFMDGAKHCTVAARERKSPNYAGDWLGFRIARSAVGPTPPPSTR